MRYALDCLASTQFYCNSCTSCPLVNDPLADPSCPTVSRYVITEYGFEYDNRWLDVLVLILFILLWTVGTYLGLKYVNHLKR